MTFAVEDFQDLLRLLDEHPDWQRELRRRLLTDELLELPALFRQLTERIDTLAERMDALVAAQIRTEQRLEALTGQIAVSQELTQGRLNVLESLMGQLIAQMQEVMGRVGDHSGSLLEMDYARKYGAFFGRIARRLRETSQARLITLIEDGVDEGRITMVERDDLLPTDLILEGRRRSDDAEVFIAVEVSWGVGRDDIERAARRARTLAKLGKPGVAVVAGKWMDSMLEPVARSHGVWCVLNGSTRSPEGLLTA